MRKLFIEIILTVIGLGLVFGGVNSYFKQKKQYEDLKSAYTTEQNNSVQYKKINDSLTVAFVNTQVVSKETAEILFKKELEAYSAQTGSKLKNLESLLKTQVNSHDTYITNNIDTAECKVLDLSYSDKYNKIDITVKDGVAVIDSRHNTYLTKYTYKARRNAAWYKPWKWGKDLRTEVKSDNPKDSIINIQEIIIK